jgi:quinoprotein glucose dehydrogenase
MMDTATRNAETVSVSRGNALYIMNCAACHGADRKGSGSFPTLVDIREKRSPEEIKTILKTGSGRMPSFQRLTDTERKAITDFILNPWAAGKPMEAAGNHPERKQVVAAVTEQPFGFEPAYISRSWRKLTDSDGYPAIKPPWGTLNAIDLKTGDYLWRVPLGEFPELTKKGIPVTGMESYGGTLVTAGGLVFIAGTGDEKIRAFDKKTGKVLWEYLLPAAGFATPVTYEANGKQYVVIAAAGGRGQKAGGNYVAFALE